jgi:16S rRNA (guanine527-N7)-methyltransferase
MRAGCEGSRKRHKRVGEPKQAGLMQSGARELGIELADNQLRQLEDYAAMVRRWNAKFNLVSRQDTNRFELRHVLDSLTVVPYLQAPRVLDLGSGAGLPGIPLAIACPELEMVLLDRGERKARFLRQVVVQTGLANVSVCCQDARDALSIGPFSSVVTRAVATPANIWRLAEPLLADDGVILMMHRIEQAGDSPGDDRPAMQTVTGAALTRHFVGVPGLLGQHEILSMRRASA